MLTLPAFEHHLPTSVEEALSLLQRHAGDVKLLAGGTDLLPNMKHRLTTPGHVVSLQCVPDLQEVKEEGVSLRIGARVTLAALARHPLIQAKLPSLAEAASQVAGPQLREAATLGGNLCLDTRCVYYNQTYFWRQALGFCLKKDGTVCHVVKGGKNCVAAASNDTAPVLMTLDATVRIAGPRGPREVALTDFYVPDGIANTVLEPDELVLEVVVPIPGPQVRLGYQKLRVRAAIDYSALCLGVAAQVDAAGTVEWARLVVSALGSRPHVVKRLEPLFGRRLDADWIAEVGKVAFKQCHPLTNINVDPQWRREVLPVYVARAFEQARPVR